MIGFFARGMPRELAGALAGGRLNLAGARSGGRLNLAKTYVEGRLRRLIPAAAACEPTLNELIEGLLIHRLVHLGARPGPGGCRCRATVLGLRGGSIQSSVGLVVRLLVPLGLERFVPSFEGLASALAEGEARVRCPSETPQYVVLALGEEDGADEITVDHPAVGAVGPRALGLEIVGEGAESVDGGGAGPQRRGFVRRHGLGGGVAGSARGAAGGSLRRLRLLESCLRFLVLQARVLVDRSHHPTDVLFLGFRCRFPAPRTETRVRRQLPKDEHN